MSSKEETRMNKRQKRITDDLICPIMLELPVDPVVARDGRIDERSAIEQHFKTVPGRCFTSPVTNEKLEDDDLLPSFQTKNLISSLIEEGDITGDLMVEWKEKAAQSTKELLKRASDGDADAAYLVYKHYNTGTGGFNDHPHLAFQWLVISHKGGCVDATARLGKTYLSGRLGGRDVVVVTENVAYGLVLITDAANKGSRIGAYLLGSIFARGKCGIPVGVEQAKRWLLKSLDDEDRPHSKLNDATQKKAKRLLKTLTGSNEEDEEE